MTGALLLDWVKANSPWLGYAVMALLGGAIAHIQEFEKSQVEWPLSRHVRGCVIAWSYAFFIALIIYNMAQEYWNVPPPVCFALTGLASVFGSETIRWMYDRGRALLSAKLPGGKDSDGK